MTLTVNCNTKYERIALSNDLTVDESFKMYYHKRNLLIYEWPADSFPLSILLPDVSTINPRKATGRTVLPAGTFQGFPRGLQEIQKGRKSWSDTHLQ